MRQLDHASHRHQIRGPYAMISRTTGRKAVRVGLVGAGQRAAPYFRNVPNYMAGSIRLAAIADPDPARRQAFADLLVGPSAPPGEPSDPDGAQPELLDDGLAMLRDHELDVVVVATPNDQHVRYALAAMERWLPLLVEKPVATTVDGLRALWQAEQARPAGRTAVGFVLRYTPFYERVREIVRSGRLGQILAIQADENLGTGLT